ERRDRLRLGAERLATKLAQLLIGDRRRVIGGEGRQIAHERAASWIAWAVRRRAGMSASGSCAAASLRARAGSGCVSTNSASTPTATAARIRWGAYSRCAPEAFPRPPGCWRLWVASYTTGKPRERITGSPRKSTTRLL